MHVFTVFPKLFPDLSLSLYLPSFMSFFCFKPILSICAAQVLFKCDDIPWSMVSLPGFTPRKRTDFLSQQLSVASAKVGLAAHSPLHVGILSSVSFAGPAYAVRAAVSGKHCFAVVIHHLWLFDSFCPLVPSSTMIPEPWRME